MTNYYNSRSTGQRETDLGSALAKAKESHTQALVRKQLAKARAEREKYCLDQWVANTPKHEQ